MINQTLSTNIASSNAFNEFKQPKNGYFLMPTQKEEKEHHYGRNIAISAMVVGFGTLAIMKGVFPKKLSKILENVKFKLEEKIAKGGKFTNFYRKLANSINSFIEKSQSINNITSLKDVLFQKLMFGKNGERKFTKKIHEGITKFFDKMSRKTVNSSYAKTQNKFAALNETMQAINERLLKGNSDPKLAQAIQEINVRLVRVNDNLDKGFGINARNKRLQQINDATKDLFDYFWNASFSDIKNFKSKNMWQSFIAEDYILPHKMKMSNEVGLLRQRITHNILDNYTATMKAFDNIKKFINPADTESRSILVNLRKNLSDYKKLSGKDEITQRATLNKKIIENLKALSDTFKDPKHNYSEEAQKSISNYIKEVEEIISKSSKGELQEILTLYKGVLPRNEYLKLKAQVQSAVSTLDKSIDMETVQYFDKVRDLKLGSAPTDVLSIIGGVGTVGWFLGKSKDKDERISASLKFGIPAVGAIATSLYSTARLVSGGKSLALGLISGWVMNRIGEYVDKTRKKYSLDISLQNKTLVKPQPDKV